MRRFYYIGLIFLALNIYAQAQNANQGARVSRGSDRSNQQAESNTGLPELSVRAQILNEQLTQDIGKARWMRVIYRELDLTKDKNAPLYYPVQETNGVVNLFTRMFRLISEGKLNVYRYLTNDSESFEDDNILVFKEMLDNFNIYFEEVPAGGGRPARYVINASDVPSNEVRSLYVKEAWYFDESNSLFDVKTLAICPIAYLITDIGEQPTPMFWAKYEDVRPYVTSNYIMTSNINNAKTYTVDDFFRRRMYDGEIVKTENLLNLAMQQLYPDPDTLRVEQQRIEDQLMSFNDSLWIKPDTTVVLSKKEAKAVTRSNSKSVSANNKNTKKESTPKQPKEKAVKTSPARSIRR